MEKFTEHIREILKEKGRTDKDIAIMSPDEAFREVLEWGGIIGYDGAIKRWIKAIYGMEVKEQREQHTEKKDRVQRKEL